MTEELLYVSWGGTGRAASLRQALRKAEADERSVRYLAVLDDDHFADLDDAMTELVADELEWLVTAQLELTRSQVGADKLKTAVTVVAGQVVEVVAGVAAKTQPAEIMIGAPVPVAGHDSIRSLIDQISRKTGAPVELVMPDAS